MGNRGKRGNNNTKPNRQLNVCQLNTPVMEHLKAIRSSLSADQLSEVNKLVARTKAELKDWASSASLQDLRQFQKHKKLDELSDKLSTNMKEIPRDLFKHNLHYVLNGIQTQVEGRKYQLLSSRDDVTDADEDDELDVSDAEKTIIAVSKQTVHAEVHVSSPQYADAATQTSILKNTNYCVNTCYYDGKQSDQPMVRCGLCMRWFHVKCTDEPEDENYAEAAWTCPSCRLMPSIVSQLQVNIETIMDTLLQLVGVKPNESKLLHSTADQDAANISPAAVNRSATSDDDTDHSSPFDVDDDDDDADDSDESCRMPESSDGEQSHPESDDSLWPWESATTKKKLRKRRSRACIPPVKHNVTLISDSVPKNIDVNYIQRKTAAKVSVLREGRDVNKTVDYIQDHAACLRSSHIVLHTGTNNVLRESEHITMRRFDRLETNLVHHKYEHVSVSSIVHHNSRDKVREKIKNLNDHLQLMCSRNGWSYIDNDNIDASCLSHDNIHLNGLGDEKLTGNVCNIISQLLSDSH